MTKNELNTNSSTADATWVLEELTLPSTARRTIVAVCPIAPKSMSGRRPTRSMRKIATSEAKKYSVPLQAAIIRALTSSIPRRSKSNVCRRTVSQPLSPSEGSIIKATYGVVRDQVNSGDLLEALDDDTKERTAEVLRASAGEDLT